VVRGPGQGLAAAAELSAGLVGAYVHADTVLIIRGRRPRLYRAGPAAGGRGSWAVGLAGLGWAARRANPVDDPERD